MTVATETTFERMNALFAEAAYRNQALDAERDAAGLNVSGYEKRLRRGELIVTGSVKPGRKAYKCLNPECLAIFTSDEAEPACRACNGADMAYSVVAGTLTGAPCNASCTHALHGGECLCSCGGENHGAEWLRGWAFPKNVEERRADYRAARALTTRFRDADYHAMLDEAHALQDSMNLALADAAEAVDEKAREIADALLAIPADILLTKTKKPGKAQLYDLRVTKLVERNMQDPVAYSRCEIPAIEVTGVDANGRKVWARIKDYDKLFTRYIDEPAQAPVDGAAEGTYVPATTRREAVGAAYYTGCHAHCRHGSGEVRCWSATFGVGDVVRLRAQVKGEGDAITFLKAANYAGHIDTWNAASDALPVFGTEVP